MRVLLLLTLLLGVTSIVRAGGNSIEVTLEDTPQQQQAPQNSFRRWRFGQQPAQQDSDTQFSRWDYKFKWGSDKSLGTAADTSAIQASVPSTMPVTIRWVSRRVVVVAADCHQESSSGSGERCLYVFEKQGAKWKLAQHYAHRWHLPTI
jgi:hypothetical protein